MGHVGTTQRDPTMQASRIWWTGTALTFVSFLGVLGYLFGTSQPNTSMAIAWTAVTATLMLSNNLWYGRQRSRA